MSPRKKTTPKKKEDVVIDKLPDVFDDVTSDDVVTKKSRPVVVEVESEDSERETVIPEASKESAERDELLPPPTMPVRSEDDEVVGTLEDEVDDADQDEDLASDVEPPKVKERDLPSFLVHDEASTPELVVPSHEEVTAPQTSQEKLLEKTVPQAFVGELNEVSKEVKQEKRSMIVTFLIVAGLVSLITGLIGVYWVTTRKTTTEPTPTPMATPAPTAAPTPTISASPTPASASAELTTDQKKYKINVLNGTKVVGLAAKHAAALKKAGFLTGTVGNGDPTKAGTITVPTDKKSFGESIAAALPEFTFTITEDAKATTATVVLGEPKE